MRADLTVDGGHLKMSDLTEDSSSWAVLDIDAEFHGTGRSPHDIVGNADGFFVVSASEGIVDNSLLESFSNSISVEVLDMLNPRRHEKPATILHCGVIVMELEKGTATLESMAIQTKKMSMSGQGEIDFDTEKFELRWVTKPRKGFGLSVSTVTESYVRLGGTLADPEMIVKPLRAAVSTGVAVGTLGLSLLGKGLWNRFTAHRKICECALEEAEKERERRGRP